MAELQKGQKRTAIAVSHHRGRYILRYYILERNTKMFYDKDLEVLETLNTCTENMPGKQLLTAFPN